MYQHPDDNYQPQHPHLEFEHSESVWSSIKSAVGKVGGAAKRAAEKVGDAAREAKRRTTKGIAKRVLRREDYERWKEYEKGGNGGHNDEHSPQKTKDREGKKSDEDDSDEEEEEAYMSDDYSDEEGEEMVDEEYTPMHPHLQGDFEPSAWGRKKKGKGGGKISDGGKAKTGEDIIRRGVNYTKKANTSWDEVYKILDRVK